MECLKYVLLFVLGFNLGSTKYIRPIRPIISNELNTPIPANFTVSYFTQKLDHFNYANTTTFQQRILISTDHWCHGCPIFFYCGNEGDIFEFANNTGFMWENAPNFNAMVAFVEHRYYGKSMPFGQESFQGLNHAGYLSSEQALADFAEVIQHLKYNYKGAQLSPVIVFGGSYGGMLASWFRMKYPHLAEGALAASAPIWQFPGIYDCHQYYKIVTKDFTNYSPECSQTIKQSWPAIRRLSKTATGRSWMSQQFKLCKNLEANDINQFIFWISSAYENLAMTDYPNPAYFLQPLPAYPMKETCKLLKNPNQDDKPLLETIYRGISVFYNYSGEVKCNQIANDAVLTGWDFQTCTEMVMPVCSNGVDDMFENNPWNITKFSAECLKKWKTDPESLKILMMYGGKHISTASNIIFSNGERDPWSAGGVLESLSKTLVSIHIPDACHHEDLRPSGPYDPPALLDVRQMEVNIIRGWINSYYDRVDYRPFIYSLKP